ncbi:MAG: PKD domain-containing protein, partial [Asgard group archaeon]|nr:PKD domain-containing protein [Asgard group archaeon]
TLYIILSAFLIGCRDVWSAPAINSFSVSSNTADVGEEIQFNWDCTGFKTILINFGDGTPLNVSDLNSISHSYVMEGSYDAMITAIDSSGDSISQSININIKNESPQFDFTFNVSNSLAYEDDNVEITVTNLIESDVDQVPGIINYLYNFADGINNHVTTNDSSILHSWKDAGEYPVTITLIDDQGALNQVTKNITILNRIPSASINIETDDSYGQLGLEYIATYNWHNYTIGAFPEDWNRIDSSNSDSTLSTAKIVDSIDEIHYKVLELDDKSSKATISMQNSFNDQHFGTVEFWVKSSDVNSKTWGISLWDHSNMAFQILMHDKYWKYTSSTPYFNIFPSLEANNDEWNHVRIDFCIDDSSGNYNNLKAGQFKVYINDVESVVFEITNPNVMSINHVRLESGINAIGKSWIDAIGYSWDPLYQISGNRWPMTSYADNLLFLFDAANSIDSESDLDSLRYFWQYGDGATSYGKYVQHQYSKPGIYKITLMVKDDNGDFDLTSQYLAVNNMKPTLNFSSLSNKITLQEGENVAFFANVSDNLGDMTDMQYWWNFEYSGPELDQYNLNNFESGGWKNTHIYMDDYDGVMYTIVKDTEGFSSYNSLEVEVMNVDPSLSIWDASIVADTRVVISRSNEDFDNNFSVVLLGNNEPEMYHILRFGQSDNNIISTTRELILYSLSKYWKLIIDSITVIPVYSWVKYDFILEFTNGETLVITSGKLYGNSTLSWEVDLTPYFYDVNNFNFKYPLMFRSNIWDPSVDDIDLNVNYLSNILLNLSSTTPLPGGYSSTFDYTIDDVSYSIRVFEELGSILANISASQSILSKDFIQNLFPVSIELNFSLNPLINIITISDLIESNFPLTEISILKCLIANHYIDSYIADDDGGNGFLKIEIDTQNNIKIENLSPKLIVDIPIEVNEFRNITIFAQIWDFDQAYALRDAFLISPTNYEDTTIINELVCNFTANSNKLPENTHGFIETTNKTFYIIDSANTNTFLKSANQGNNWSTVVTLNFGYEISAVWYDRN